MVMLKTHVPYLRSLVRNDGRGRLGIGIELFRLDADTDAELTETEETAIEEDIGEKDKSSTAVMRIYEEIGEDFWTGGGITAKKFAKELDELGDIKRLNIHINCLGGDCHTAQAIHSILADCDAKTTSYIDGVCASAATLIACAADQVIARHNTNYMVHYPWSIVLGNSEDMRKAAEDLDKITFPIVSVYKEQVKGKIEEEKIRELMAGETWMTADEALEYGFVDEVRGKISAIAKVSSSQIFCSGRVMNIGKYQYHNVPKFKQAVGPVGCPTGPKGPAGTVGKQKGTKLMTREEIDPQLVASIEASAREKERVRLSALDAMMAPGLEELVSQAKKDGKEPNEIAMACFEVVKLQAVNAENTNQLRRDSAAANGVTSGDAPQVKPDNKQAKGIKLFNNAMQVAAQQRKLVPTGAGANGNSRN